MLRTSAINLVLKVGISAASLGFALLSFLKGTEIVAYFPRFITYIFGETVSLILGALIAVVMTVWLMSRRHKFAAAFTYTILIGLGMLFNLTSLTFISITWPLFCMSLALTIRYYPRVRVIFRRKDGGQFMKIIPAAPEEEDEGDDETPHAPHISRTSHTQKSEEKVEYGAEEPFLEDRKDNDIANKYPVQNSSPLADTFKIDIEEEQLNAMDALGPEPLGAEVSDSELLANASVSKPAIPVSEEVAPKPKAKKVKRTHLKTEHSPLAEALQAAHISVEPRMIGKKAAEKELAEPEISIETPIDENPRIAQKRRKARASKKSEVEVQ